MLTYPLIGHTNVETYFQNALVQGRLPHACLLHGPKGIGKATFAQGLAAHLLYGAPSIRQLDAHHKALLLSKAHPDCLYVQSTKEETIGVEIIRDIPAFAQRTATGWKIVIIDSIDALTVNAANALLKVLEEPPSNTIFLIITHLPGKLLPTIKSRCHGVPFHSLNADEMESLIRLWKPDLDDFTYQLVIRLSQGSLGHAQQFLEIAGEGIISKATSLFIQALSGTEISPSSLDSILKDKHFNLTTYLFTYWCQQITYLHHQQPYFLPVEFFPQNLLQEIASFSPSAWIETVAAIDQLIQQQEALKLDTKNTLLTLLHKIERSS